MEAAPGFEPGNKGFAVLCLTTWLCRLNSQLQQKYDSISVTGRQAGPFLLILLIRKAHLVRPGVLSNGAEDGIRTRDPRLGKAMLYH
jgi:hypothetical protein